MDAKSIGKTLATLRKKAGLTQSELANMLRISDKTVSKWENGQGYPDIVMFPEIAAIFNVTVDYLMLGEKKGISFAGNMLVDVVKNIDIYPKPGMLAYVSDVQKAVGGCVPNTAIDLAKIDKSIPIKAYGKIGDDENGHFLVSQMQKYGIDTAGIVVSSVTPTSFSDVMSLPAGERTFFHKKGANAEFCVEDIDLSSLDCAIFHIGYILLLDALDKEDAKYGTVMAGLLKKVQEKGIKTSIDVVSDSTADYQKKIVPALKYCDYVIINEMECCEIWGLSPYKADGVIDKKAIKEAMKRTADCGVKEKIIVHAKKIAFALDIKSGEFTELPSLKIPSEQIVGSVGAGDAFCAGALYGIYSGFDDKQILEFASASAACSLFAATSVDGMKSKREIIEIAENYERLKI